jgi:hypothetical protein
MQAGQRQPELGRVIRRAIDAADLTTAVLTTMPRGPRRVYPSGGPANTQRTEI